MQIAAHAGITYNYRKLIDESTNFRLMSPRSQTFWKDTLTLGAGLALALLAVEALTRYFVPDPDLAFENRVALFEEDATVGYRNRGQYHGWAHGVIEVRTNSLGFRGPEIEVKKAERTRRLLGLGDSVTFGTGVREQENFLSLMQSRYSAGKSGEVGRTEVVNLGVIGYSLHQEALALEKFGLPLSPDIVLVGFVLNDAYPTEDPFFNVHKIHSPPREGVRRREYNDPRRAPSYAYRLALNLYRQWKASGGPLAPPPVVWPEGGHELRAWPFMQQDFRRLKELSVRRGFRLGVILFPLRRQLGERPPVYPQGMIAEFLGTVGISALDLSAALRSDPTNFMDEMHLSKKGHVAVAEAIAQFIHERRW